MSLQVAPLTLREARAFVDARPRQPPPPQGGLFSRSALSMWSVWWVLSSWAGQYLGYSRPMTTPRR